MANNTGNSSSSSSSNGLNSCLFGEIGNRLKTASNRSLVDANKQLRIELAFAKREIVELQNETVELKRRIMELETANDEERIEIIVQRRLQQRVQHLKSIATRTVQYMKKATADFDNAANRLDHTLIPDDDVLYSGECSRTASRPLSEIENENVGRRTQRPSVLEAVEEDVFGEMDENRDGNHSVARLSDRRPITPMSEDIFKRFFELSNSTRKSHRSSRRQTFFVKREPDDFNEFENGVASSPSEVHIFGTNQASVTENPVSAVGTESHASSIVTETPVSTVTSENRLSSAKTGNSEVSPTATISANTLFEHRTPRTTPNASSAKFIRPKSVINRRVSKSATAICIRKRRGLSAIGTPKRRRRRSSGSSVKSHADSHGSGVTPRSTVSGSILDVSIISENGTRRPRRAAAAKIASFKEPSLLKKMRNPNV